MNLFIVLAVLCSPFVQLGASYWVSGATTVLLLVLLSARYRSLYLHYSKNHHDIALDVTAVLLMFTPVLLQESGDFSHDILLNARLAFFYVLLIWVVRGFSIPDFFKVKPGKTLALVIMSVSGVMLIFALIQLVKLRGGYFGLPKTWYVTNYEMLPGELDTLWAKSFRPFCTFGEPSYLAFFCISFLMPAFRMCLTKKYRKIGLITSAFLLCTGAASQSLAFLFALGILIVPATYIYLKSTKISGVAFGGIVGSLILAGGLATLAAMTILSWIGVNILGDRFGNIASGQDTSASLRIFAPLVILPKVFIGHPLGILGSEMLDTVTGYTAEAGLGFVKVIDNALFNTFFFFGLTAFFLIYRLLRAASAPLMIIYIFSCFNFNGDIFSVDKVALIGLSIALFKAFSPEIEPVFKLTLKPFSVTQQVPAA